MKIDLPRGSSIYPGALSAVFGLFFAFLFANALNGYGSLYDEGVISYGATRVAQGDIPYRDFWTMYAPGQFFAVGILFKFLGVKLLVFRLYAIIIELLSALAGYLIIRKIAGRGISFIAVCIIAVSYPYWLPIDGTPTHAAMPWALLSLFFAASFIIDRNKKNLFAAGVFSGMSLLFKQDIGAYVSLATAGILTAYVFVHLDGRNNANKVRLLATCLSGMLIVILPVFLYFAVTVPFADLWSDLVIFPLTVFPEFRKLPYPSFRLSFDAVPFYFPAAVYVLAFSRLVIALFRRQFGERDWIVLLLLLSGVLFSSQAVIRSDSVHLFATSIVAVLLLAGTLEGMQGGALAGAFRSAGYFLFYLYVLSFYAGALRGVGLPGYVAPLVLLLIVLLPFMAIRGFRGPSERITNYIRAAIAAVFIVFLVLFSRTNGMSYVSSKTFFGMQCPGAAPSRFNFMRGISVYPAEERNSLAVSGFIQARLKPGEKIFIGNFSHDRIITNDVILYNLLERGAATKYHELHPGVITTRGVQDEVIKELQAKDLSYVVLHAMAQDAREPNASALSSNNYYLDAFLRSDFTVVLQQGDYRVLKKIRSTR